MKQTNRFSMEFTLFWESKYATHEEIYFIERVDTWRDILPDKMENSVKFFEEGYFYKEFFEVGSIVAPYKENNILKFSNKSFQGISFDNKNIDFFKGRFYQKGIAWTIFNCFKGNCEPFRIIEINDDFMVADLNHPLAKFPLSLEVKVIEKLIDREERGGECNHIAEIITKDGPGFQIPHHHTATDFYNSYPFSKINDEKDINFYDMPRFVNHLDDYAIKKVKSIFSKFLQQNTKILDLMSSWTSHLPEIFEKNEIIGLGLNKLELSNNNVLSDYVIHDLNIDFQLPFIENEFDAVICTSSIEYLIQPIEVIKEVVRVLKPGGIFITTISDRWFDNKEIMIWSDLHAFERLGFILDLYLKNGNFKKIKTKTIRGFPRPYYDKHIKLRAKSDPIFAVSGIVTK